MVRFTAAKTPHLIGSVEISEVILGAPAVLFVTKMEISDEQVKYLRRVLERFFGASISLPTKTSWCQATVVALLWSACKSLATTHPASWDAPSRGCDRVDDLLGHQVIAQ